MIKELAHPVAVITNSSMLRVEKDLRYRRCAKNHHALNLLSDVVGTAAIAKKVKQPLDLNIACHYVCHLSLVRTLQISA